MLESLINNLFYFKESCSVDGKTIRVPKFKSMIDSPLKISELAFEYGMDKFGKINGDPRVTPFGSFIRKYWIDELPQFYSILKGDMSLVGIRPRDLDSWKLFDDRHKEMCLEFKPGLIGIPYGFSKRFDECKSDYELNRRKLAIERLYCMKKKKNPIKTDLIFGSKVAYNIIFKGLRSS